MRKSLWSPDEDEKLRQYVAKHGCGNWSEVAKHTGLHRCGKSCRLRWINYLRPDLKRGPFTAHEVRLVVNLHHSLGNSWSKIANHLPGRTDNDVKNFWHSYTRSRRLQQQQQQQHRMDLQGSRDDESFISNQEKPCYLVNNKDIYNPHTPPGVKKKGKEEEHVYIHAHNELQLPPLMFTSGNNIIANRKPSSIDVDNASPHHFNVYKDNQFASSSSNPSIPITNTNHSNPLLHDYSTAQLHIPTTREVIRATNVKPIMIQNHQLDTDSDSAMAATRQSRPATDQTSRSKLPLIYPSSFDHSTSSLEASSSAVSSASHKKGSNTQVSNAPDECSFMFNPASMQVNYLLNSQVLADDVPAAASFDQANSIDMDSKVPEGLQSVIWRFFNHEQEYANQQAAGSSSLDAQRAHRMSHQFSYHHQNPPSIAISSVSLPSDRPCIQPPIDLSSTDQLLNVEEAFSSSANLQYLQAQLAAHCFS